jgi:hypothetical protein
MRQGLDDEPQLENRNRVLATVKANRTIPA